MADTPEKAAEELRPKGALDPARIQAAILKECGLAMKQSSRDNFDQSHGPDGNPWAALRFPRPRGGDKPLLDTGQLRASVVTNHIDHIETVTPTSIEIGTVRKGARLMQEGGTVVPVNAKALAIPLTKEALNRGGPRQFPRPLTMLWRTGAESGVLAEVDKSKRKVSSREKALRKQAGQYTAKERAYLKQIKNLRKRAKARPKSAKAIAAKISLVYSKLRAYQKSIGRKVRLREQLAQKRKASFIKKVHYVLVKMVRVPARPFVGFGQRLIKRCEEISLDVLAKALGKGGKR